MGRKKSKGKKKNGSKRAHRREEEEEASDNGCSDSEQARALPPPKSDNASENGGICSDLKEAAYSNLLSYILKSLNNTTDVARNSNQTVTIEDQNYEKQLSELQLALRLDQETTSNEDAVDKLPNKEEASRIIRLNYNTNAIADNGMKVKDLIRLYYSYLSTINIEYKNLPPRFIERRKKNARDEAEMAEKNLTMLRQASANVDAARRLVDKVNEWEAASAVDQATSNSSTVTSNLQSGNNGTHFLSGLSTATENNAELAEGRNTIGVNLNENSPLEIRSNRNIASMAVAENTRVENNGAGHSSKTELDLTIARLGNLNINENSPSEARSETSLEGSLNNSDQITDNSAQGLLQENNNIISNNQSSTPTRRNSSVRKKVKNNNSNVKRTPK